MKGFTSHIFEALVINGRRLPLYAKETQGRSLIVSIGLMSFEVSILPLAVYYDLTTSHWRKLGLPVMEQDFIPMEETPPYCAKTTDIPDGAFRVLPIKDWRVKTNRLMKEGKWEEAYNDLREVRESLEEEAKVFPLILHFLESVHRSIGFTVLWSQKLDEGLKRKFLRHRRWFVFWQMVGYEGALALDYLAQRIRKEGCPILEQDVPIIPVPKI